MEYNTANANLSNVLETMHKVVKDRERGMRVADNMIAIEQKVNVLTLDAPTMLDFEGNTFSSAEHLLAYFKAVGAGDTQSAKQIARSPNIKTALSVPIKGFQSHAWKKIEYKAVETVTAIKLKQLPSARDMLKSTGSKHIVYASKADTFFGCGLSINDDNLWFPQFWKGQNALGAILTNLRRKM